MEEEKALQIKRLVKFGKEMVQMIEHEEKKHKDQHKAHKHELAAKRQQSWHQCQCALATNKDQDHPN